MPQVQIELILNDKGVVTGVKKAKDLGDAADQAMKSVQGLGNSSKSLSVLGREAGEAAINVRSLTTRILALVGAYKALQGVGSYINRIFDFSSSLESSQVAIASVIGATNKIKDSQGRTLEGAEKFNAAQQISAKLMDEIQIRALETTATFDELVSGVSGIIAPATKAGVAIEKLPKFAVTAAQAMAAMKIPTQQMRTEIESLLSGNINKVQDILATNLGITGEMVKNWQKQGTLIEEIEKRLSIFAEAGEATAQSWAGLKNNLQDAYDYLSAKTGKGVFEGAKQSYREFLDLLVNTKGGKLGVGEDIENIVARVQQLQNEIGNELVSVTREFIGYIRELNKPENLDELEGKLKDIWGAAKTGIGTVKAIGGAIATLIDDIIEGWQMLPEPIREYGLLMALLGGKRVKVAFAAIAYANKGYETIKPMLSGDFGMDEVQEIWNTPGSITDFFSTLDSELDKRRGSGQYFVGPPRPTLRQRRESDEANFVGPPKPLGSEYETSNDIGGFGGDKDKGASKIASAREQLQKIREEIAALNGEATKSSNSLEQKEREIEKLGKAAGLSANDIDKLKTQYGDAFKANALQGFNKQIAQLEGNTKALRDIQLDEEVKKWSASFNELVSKGKMTTGEAAANIDRLKTAISKQTDLKNLQTATSFYKELGELSGNYGLSIKYQNMLIREQRDAWKAAGIPDELIDEWEKLKGLQVARDPLSGSIRGLRSYSNEAMNLAKGIEGAWTSGFTAMEDALVKFTMSGKLSFSDMANSIISDLMRIAIRSSITGPLASGLGSIFSGMFGGGVDTSSAGTDLLRSNTVAFAHGGVLSGGSIHGLSNSIVSTPTPFSFNQLVPFAQGGVVGETFRPEAIAPLARMSNGDLGIRASGFGGSEVSVNIYNSTGEQVSQRTKTDNNGKKSIDIMVGDAAAKQMVTSGSSLDKATRARFGIQPQATRR